MKSTFYLKENTLKVKKIIRNELVFRFHEGK